MIQLCFLFFLETSTSIDKKNVSKTKKVAIDTFFVCDDIPSNAPQTIKKSRFFTSQSDCAFPVQSMRKQCFKQKKHVEKISVGIQTVISTKRVEETFQLLLSTCICLSSTLKKTFPPQKTL